MAKFVKVSAMTYDNRDEPEKDVETVISKDEISLVERVNDMGGEFFYGKITLKNGRVILIREKEFWGVYRSLLRNSRE